MADEQNLVGLKRRRATIQGSCTRIKTFVESVESISPSIKAQLEERQVRLGGFWSDYQDVQAQIELLDEAEASHRAGFEEAYYKLSARVRELLAPPVPVPEVVARSPSSEAASTRLLAHVRLPKLDLPSFSGEYDEWFPFRDTFNSILHTNESLTDIQRLQYLKGCLRGDASKLISSLEISAVNYEVAWNLLKSRYDNKLVIVQSHVRAIMELPSMNKENSLDLRQIADGASRHVNALKALGRPTSQWDDLLVFILSNKLDTRTEREWQASLSKSELPTLKQFIDFITQQCQTLEATAKNRAPVQKGGSRSQVVGGRQAVGAATVKTRCTFCRGEHSIYYCKEFLALPIPKRIAEVRKNKTCINCLRSTSHVASKCTSGSCRLCKSKHNTLLHVAATTSGDQTGEAVQAAEVANVTATTSLATRNCQNVMLSTALVHAYDINGTRIPCRALLDSGSQANFISRGYADRLGVESRVSNISISGVGGTVTKATQIAQVRIQSRTGPFSAKINCIVTDQVTDRLPAVTLKRKDFDIPRNITLADPTFNIASDIDMLIGAELFWSVISVGQIEATEGCPTLQKTKLGWILAGRFANPSSKPYKVHVCHAKVSNSQLHDSLARFWRLENIEGQGIYTSDELRCEKEFLQSVTRNPQGRYVVRLPFKDHAINNLGETKDIALRRLHSLENRLARNATLKLQYSRFLHEYLALGHMKQIINTPEGEGDACYLPHHCVFKTPSQPTSIRVVFDASAKSSTGISLNDVLMTGPVVQQDLIAILLRFRMFRIVFAADIIKMYRQILIDPAQRRYQRILWRDDPSQEVRTYELSTITYGTSPASYLATRCLKLLAESSRDKYPLGSICVQRDFYVDDLLTGADTVGEAKKARDEAISLLRTGSFELSKWASNAPELLKDIRDLESNAVKINDFTGNSRILGMLWNQFSDTFLFSSMPNESTQPVSKRVILTEVSRLFDPLGLLGPAVVVAKLILQDLWQLEIHWDESIPPDILSRWAKFRSQLLDLNKIKIPRCVRRNGDPQHAQIHGFCDASQRAFGACVYIRTPDVGNKFQVVLLCSKSRVAPLKAVTLPRLELSAALLLAQLIHKIKDSVESANMKIFLWSDSTITLNWINSPSRKWAVFVANRVGEIQRLTDSRSWRHVSSANNPADALSRGCDPRELVDSSSWWHGPAFLTTPEGDWP
ncbi:PREDICTED: uncharacterized protein LOC105569657, partial [Vollenhovia emeryi]|uniref:uncharacterized protein LOC105569657 n=1 Tax=Vollenhovia emeryi TaxID=411798 RepID=UPI0005F438DF